MTAKDINTALFKMFDNYEYKLNNTIVFDWESDFFAQSKSGYFIECEVKISRSDFFKDFKKDKHRLFQDVCAGKSHHITRGEISTWEIDDRNIIGRVNYAWMQTQFGDFGQRHNYRSSASMVSDWHRWQNGVKNGKRGYWVNDYGDIRIVQHFDIMRAPFTRINIQPMEKIHIPNRFYYAVPEGLIQPKEVPKYAGLVYITKDNGYRSWNQVKSAPFLHKRTMDLDKLLLKKYYNLWQFKVPHETKEAIRKNYSE